MSELFPDFSAVVADIAAANDALREQNERLQFTHEITDDDFKSIVIAGLAQEQQATFDQRQNATKDVDFAAIGAEQETVLAAQRAPQAEIANIEASVADIQKQAELGARISPAQAQQLQELADFKKAEKQLLLKEAREQLGDLEARALGYAALSMPWEIPQIPGVSTRTNQSSTEAIVEHRVTETVPTTSETAEVKPDQVITPDHCEPQTNPEELEAILQSVLWAVYDYSAANSEKGVRIEEMRKVVPELAQLSDTEYQYFKHKFSAMRENIVNKLASMGVHTEWTVSGQTRGTRYHVITLDKPKTPINTLPEYTPGSATKSSVATVDKITPSSSIANNPLALDESLDADTMRNIPLIATLLSTVSNLQVLNGAESQKRSYLSRAIANELGIDVADAGYFLSKLVGVGLLFERGHQKGIKLISTVQGNGESEAALTQDIDIHPMLEAVQPQIEQIAVSSPEDEEEVKLIGVLKRGVNATQNSFVEISVNEAAKQFGIKNDRVFAGEVEKWVTYLTENPMSPATRKIKAFRNITVDDVKTPLYRFSPVDCSDLATNSKYRRYRVVYAYVDKTVVLVDILDHDTFDAKYN